MWLRQEGAQIDVANSSGQQPLHFACCEGHLPVARWLRESAGAQVGACDATGYTPLHYACEEGHLDLARWLRGEGAEVEVGDDMTVTLRERYG